MRDGLQHSPSFIVNWYDKCYGVPLGVLVEAMRNGHWIILDELNLAPTDVLEALNRVTVCVVWTVVPIMAVYVCIFGYYKDYFSSVVYLN